MNEMLTRQTQLQERLLNGKRKSKTKLQLDTLEQELAQFNMTYYSVHMHEYHYDHNHTDTSDDTKALEHRPHKRQVITDSHSNHHGRLDSLKKFKPYTSADEGCRPSSSS
ncbi:hypothetical protein RhiirA4_459939 [Rhizophagus irregularis]|uniref:Uncharacterized protein n=1 Tax=Rhizophagus irregularis TaxID=588596 RepID=A0A2I1GFG3_9GLOM|nr:hypothetical protein RhiirA4_459939 [Rhizophagus irregularis]